MPRANRYIQSGCAYHLTHRCHDRRFLFRFARDRTEYQRRLREALGAYELALLTYCITSNHTHLLVCAQAPEDVSRFMQKLEGEFAEYYNRRKGRSGAFWDGRYGCTMVDTGRYVWNCMRYVDLNMVRAGVVEHPSGWAWCGYGELAGTRQRYRLLDRAEVLAQCGEGKLEAFRANYRASIQSAVEQRLLAREPWWTESIAVGGESFVRAMARATTNRRELTLEEATPAQWTLRESAVSYA
jgi:putative transposase